MRSWHEVRNFASQNFRLTPGTIGMDFEKSLPNQIWISKLRWSLQSNVYSENGVGWPDDRHGLSPILYDTVPHFVCMISYCAIVFSFALMFANGWFAACDGFYGASTCWLSHMKQ